MQSDLQTTTLGAICKQQSGAIQTGPFGSQLHASDYSDSGTPVVMPLNLVNGTVDTSGIARVASEHVERLSRHCLIPNDIVFSRRGDVTRFALITERERGWLCGTGCLKVSVGEATIATPDFVAAALASPDSKEWLIRHAVGATMPNLNTGILGRLPIRLPSLAIQEVVTSVLGALNDRARTLRQTNTILEAIAQALFKSWFVDFDPVHAKAGGREPDNMDAATAALFPGEFEESELGLIPKGWRAATLDDVSQLNATSWSKKRHPDTVAYVDLSSTDRNRIDASAEFSFSEAPSRARRSLQDGDTIVGTVRPKNRAFAYIHRPAANLTGSTGFAVLSPKESVWAPFVYLAATRNDNIDRLANLADGGAYPAVRPNAVSATPAVIPSTSIITAFARVTAPLLQKIGENRAAETTLAELHDTLLPRLISGKLRLPETECIINTTIA